ncbi:MAG: ABC transporter ATP-binding protein [Chloroflexi bacterium]|nr:ABC transporter ATP-binding protein [Chloroflexota bacterium]
MQAQAARRPSGGMASLGRAIRYLGNHKRSTILAYGALFIATIAQLAVPLMIQNMINSVTRGVSANSILSLPQAEQGAALADAELTLEQVTANAFNAEQLIINATILIVAFAVMRALFSFVQAFMAETTSQGVAFDFRNDVFTKLQRLSFSYYDQHQTGQLMVRATDDVEKLRLFIAQGLVLAVQAFVLLAGALIILMLINFRLTLVVLPILPIALVLFMVFGAVAQPLFAEFQVRLSRLNTILQENLAGIKVVKAFTRERSEQEKYQNANDRMYQHSLRIGMTFAFLFPTIFLVAQVGQAVLLYFGGNQILGGTLALGDYQAFSLYTLYVFFPIGQLGFIITLMAQASASAERVFDILDAESDVSDKPDAIAMPSIEGQVEFRGVSFRYFDSGDDVLSNVSFRAEPGQTIALLGATGSGKTTIINLIPRFYDVSDGAVLIDGHDLRDLKMDTLRSQIGIVLQETNLFNASIRENIAFGRPNASQDEIEAAAQAAAAHDFITSFPNGYDTKVGERGTTLSGGQKQRVAIARALILDPKLLILDDSTSNVDLETEYHIQQALDRLMQGRTSFVIAQRITTVLNADQIIVLDKGQVAAVGTHSELIERSPIYAEIYNSQLVEDVEVNAALPQAAGK